jgi:hypothetical protein
MNKAGLLAVVGTVLFAVVLLVASTAWAGSPMWLRAGGARGVLRVADDAVAHG